MKNSYYEKIINFWYVIHYKIIYLQKIKYNQKYERNCYSNSNNKWYFCILSLLSEYKINIYAYFMSPLNKDNKIIMNL